MTRSSLLKLSLVLMAAVALNSCQHPRERRIQENLAVFSTLPVAEQAAVRQGRVLAGMSTDAVYIALGTPTETTTGSAEGKTAETWIYRGVQTVPVYNNYYYNYCHPAYRHYQPFPEYDYIAYNRAIITFINQRVVAVQQRR